MKVKVKVNWSGGKDSTAALLLYIDLGYEIDAVCYIPMLTEKIPLIEKAQYEYLKNTAKKFEVLGVRVHFVHGETYKDHVLKMTTRGKNKGKIYGFPSPFTCAFKRDSKMKALTEIDKILNYDIEDIGIAFDEQNRFNQLKGKKVSILKDLKIKEKEAFEVCKQCGFLSPVYENKKRDGCAVCGNAKESERERYFSDYPEAKTILKELNYICKKERPDRAPLHGKKWFFE